MVALPTVQDLLERLRPGIQRALLESNRGAMSKGEAASVASDVIFGRGLPAKIASRITDRPACTLVAFDADRIQDWVFASERIQVAAGASFTLESLNAQVDQIQDTKQGFFRRSGVRQVYGVIYSAGGGGMLIADGRRPAEVLEREVKEWLEERSGGLTFTVVAEPLTPRDLAAPSAPIHIPGTDMLARRLTLVDGLPGALTRLLIRVRERKDSRPSIAEAAQFEAGPGGALERCPSCRRRPPGKPYVESDDPEFWCGRCRALRRTWRDASSEDPYARITTFEDLAGASPLGRGYLAFLALDGNGMGSVFRGVQSLLQLRAFSEATTAIYTDARAQAVPVLESGYLDAGWDARQAHLSLLSGGDEITLVLPSSAAPEVASRILRSVETGFEEACAPGELLHEAFDSNPKLLEFLQSAGAGAGLVMARPTYPVSLLRRYATELQREAKRACAAQGARSGVAWTLLTDSSPVPEGLQTDQPLRELTLDRFDRQLEEARAALDEELPPSALQRLIEHGRAEEASIRTLAAGPGRDEVLNLLTANFFRYQLARSTPLRRWWHSVLPEAARSQADEIRTVQEWFATHGLGRLERLSELISIEPRPRARLAMKSGGQVA